MNSNVIHNYNSATPSTTAANTGLPQHQQTQSVNQPRESPPTPTSNPSKPDVQPKLISKKSSRCECPECQKPREKTVSKDIPRNHSCWRCGKLNGKTSHLKAHLRTHEGCKQKLEKTIENLSNKSRSIDTLEKELKTSELNNQKLEGEVERLKTNLELDTTSTWNLTWCQTESYYQRRKSKKLREKQREI